MSYDLASGAVVGVPRPSQWGVGRPAAAPILDWAKDGASVIPSLFFDFVDQHYLRKDDYVPQLNLLGACARDTRAQNPNWSFRSGDPVGWLEEYGVDEHRVGDYGPLVESAGTNHLKNPRGEGGTPGTLSTVGVLPSNWTVAGIANSAVELVGVTTSQGWNRVRLRFNGTPTADIVLGFEDADQIVASNGQDWTLSGGVAIAAGDLTNIDGLRFRVTERTAAGAAVGAPDDSDALAADSVHRRFIHSHTLAGGGTVARVSGEYVLDWDGSGAVDITLDVFVPQLENATEASSPILPPVGTPATSTRAADIVTGVTTARDSGGWYDDTWDFTSGGVCGNLTEFLPNVPRVGPQGLLVEASTTNEIRNPRGVGASGSTEPTHWSIFSSWAAIATWSYGTRDGRPYARVDFNGTPSGNLSIPMENQSHVSAAQGQDWCMSVGLELASGDLTNISFVDLRLREADSGGGFLTGQDSADISGDLDGKPKRFVNAATLSEASTAYVAPLLFIGHAGGPVNFSLYIYAPQLEQKSYPTSVVLPEPGVIAASTRAADEVTLDVSGWLGGSGHTLYASGQLASLLESDRRRLVSLDDGSASNRINLSVMSTGAPDAFVAAEGNTASNVAATEINVSAGDEVRIAQAVAKDNFATSYSGGDQDTDDSGAVPVGLTKLRIGDWHGGSGQQWGGFVQQVRYFPTRLSNSELEALVA